jgi:sulfoxide reductase heme-binding subunit YedZ
LLGYSRERWLDVPGLKRDTFEWRMSMSLALTAVLFLIPVLAIGPLNMLRKRANPTNSYLRRDLGIWVGVLGLAHMVFGISIHSDNLRFWTLWIIVTPGRPLRLVTGWFGLANYAGLLLASLLALLLAISNDIAMRRLGMRRWKNLQRLSYLALLAIMIHGLAYQELENRDLGLRLVFWGMIAFIIVIQGLGLFTTLRQRREKLRLAPE